MWVGDIWLIGGARFKAVSEMPCPCVQDLQQATGKLPITKINLTSDLTWRS